MRESARCQSATSLRSTRRASSSKLSRPSSLNKGAGSSHATLRAVSGSGPRRSRTDASRWSKWPLPLCSKAINQLTEDQPMKVEIYTHIGPNNMRPKLVWRGELQQIPPSGDLICVRDGWCSETVAAVHWDLPIGVVEITLETEDP